MSSKPLNKNSWGDKQMKQTKLKNLNNLSKNYQGKNINKNLK